MATNFTDHGGAVIQFVRLQLIYWGNAWAANPAPTPTSAQVTDAMNRIVSGGYLSGLAQYRGIGQGYILGSVTVTASSPPQNFTDAQVATLIQGLISAGTIPNLDRDNQTLYMVITPKGINHQGGGAIGEHTYYTDGSGRRVHFSWVTNNGTLSYISIIASHEIGESMTDPEGTSILGDAGTCSGGGWCEIGDVCQGTNGTVNGASRAIALVAEGQEVCCLRLPQLHVSERRRSVHGHVSRESDAALVHVQLAGLVADVLDRNANDDQHGRVAAGLVGLGAACVRRLHHVLDLGHESDQRARYV